MGLITEPYRDLTVNAVFFCEGILVFGVLMWAFAYAFPTSFKQLCFLSNHRYDTLSTTGQLLWKVGISLIIAGVLGLVLIGWNCNLLFGGVFSTSP